MYIDCIELTADIAISRMSQRIKIGINVLMSMECHWPVAFIRVATIAVAKPNVSHYSKSRSRIVRAR